MAEQEASDTDLSSGTLSKHRLSLLAVQRDEARLRIFHQSAAFWLGVAFILAMTAAFLLFVKRIVCVIEESPGLIDWHVLLLGSGLIVPPTIIIFALIHRAFVINGKNQGDELPCTGPVKEVVSMAKELAEMAGDLAKKIGS